MKKCLQFLQQFCNRTLLNLSKSDCDCYLTGNTGSTLKEYFTCSLVWYIACLKFAQWKSIPTWKLRMVFCVSYVTYDLLCASYVRCLQTMQVCKISKFLATPWSNFVQSKNCCQYHREICIVKLVWISLAYLLVGVLHVLVCEQVATFSSLVVRSFAQF